MHHQVGVRLQFSFVSHLDDENRIQDFGAHVKAAVKAQANSSGRELFDEVRGLRNDNLSFLHVDPFDPNEGCIAATKGPRTTLAARCG